MHDEVLVPKAAKFFPRLARFRGFYLVGGTALALYMGHRVSVDFDLFSSSDSLPPRLLQNIKKVFAGSSIAITYRTSEQLNLTIDGVKFTFFAFGYPLVDSLHRYKKVPMAGISEIAAMKAFSIGKRLVYKDYVDWYFLLKEGYVKLADVVRVAQKKFAGDFNDRLFLGQLISLKDVPVQKIDFLKNEVKCTDIQRFLEQTVEQYAA